METQRGDGADLGIKVTLTADVINFHWPCVMCIFHYTVQYNTVLCIM